MVKPHESNLQTGGEERQNQEKMSCNCNNDNHPINETVMLITPILKKETIKQWIFVSRGTLIVHMLIMKLLLNIEIFYHQK